MKDFYVQLLSNASTSEFTDNKANSFKNRLPYPLLFESDKEWKVGLASVSYPIPPSRPHQVPVPQAHDFDDDDYVFGIEWTIETFRLQDDGFTWSPFRYHVPFDVYGKELNRDRHKVTSGRSLMQYLINRFHERLYHYMDRANESLRAPDGKKYYPVFRWEGNDLILDNTDTFLNESGDRKRPRVYFGSKLVKKLGLIREESYYSVHLNVNMIKIFHNDTVPSDFKKDWTDHSDNRSHNFWNMNSSGTLQLSPYCNWRFSYLDEEYAKTYRGVTVRPDLPPPRSPMYLYSNVGRSTITGNRVTDLLREVPHDSAKTTYEPTQIQYKPVRSNVLDIVEEQLAENDGRLVDFTSGVTSVTLHFKDE